MAALSRAIRLTTGLVTLLLSALQPLIQLIRNQVSANRFDRACTSRVQQTWLPMSWIRFGLFRFRSPLLSESRFLSFPSGTEMVHFPEFALACLCIQQVVLEVCSRGFPHSEISGYNACVRLTEAYRSLPRPSSPVSAKASTVRP